MSITRQVLAAVFGICVGVFFCILTVGTLRGGTPVIPCRTNINCGIPTNCQTGLACNQQQQQQQQQCDCVLVYYPYPNLVCGFFK